MTPRPLAITLADRVTLVVRLREDERAALGRLAEPPEARAALVAYLGLPADEVPTLGVVEREVGTVDTRSHVRELLLEVAGHDGRRSGSWRPDPERVARARRIGGAR